MSEDNNDTGSALMKIVESISISPEDAKAVVKQYEEQVRSQKPDIDQHQLTKIVTDKIIQRYSKLAATSGGTMSLAGVIPGLGTAVSMIGGGLADTSICINLQIDMTMCLAVAINKELSNEDAKHISFYIALSGSLENIINETTKKAASKAATRIANDVLKGVTLKMIKELFKMIGINFTKKAALKAIPFGIGVVVGSSTNYALSRYVGSVARDALLIHASNERKK